MILKNFRLFNNGKVNKGEDLCIQHEIIEGFCNGKADSIHEVYDCKNFFLVPGLIDLQLYGAGGYVFDNELTKTTIQTIHAKHLQYGTTSFLITLPSAPIEKIRTAIEIVRQTLLENHTGLVGLHLEGPFINSLKKGAHNEAYIRISSAEEIEEIIEIGKGVVKMITIAPEIFPQELLEKLIASDIIVSAGHSNATFEEAQSAFDKGVKCSTHLFNAMSQLEGRAPGLVGACLSNPGVWSTIIVDGKHVSYDTLRLAFKLNSERLVLISDATFLDADDNGFKIGDMDIQKKGNEFYTMDGRLAGSSISLMTAVKNCIVQVGVPIEEAFKMATHRPASLLHEDNIGDIKKGCLANLILLNENYDIAGIIFRGEWRKFIS